MNFNTLFLKSFRVLLLPLAALYGLIIIIRNRLFDRQILKSAEFNFPIICVGNLAVGGTGKSPMVEYLLTLLSPKFKMATLSRGYKRRTKGYALANESTTALEIGDEPMQFALKFPNVAVAVGEERIIAIPHLLQDHPDLQGIILDDAFQHRTVKAGFNILLTEFNNLYTRDFFLPTGDLRDEWASAKRAQVIIVTKCPADLDESAKDAILKDLNPLPEQKVYFSTIEYGIPYHICDANIQYAFNSLDEVMLVCGIANPKPLKDFLLQKAKTYYQQDYADHHIFSIDDLKEIKQLFDEISAERKLIVTTEKDAVRLIKFKEELKSMPFFVIPIRHRILFDESWQLNDQLIKFVQHFPFKPIIPEYELEKA